MVYDEDRMTNEQYNPNLESCVSQAWSLSKQITLSYIGKITSILLHTKLLQKLQNYFLQLRCLDLPQPLRTPGQSLEYWFFA